MVHVVRTIPGLSKMQAARELGVSPTRVDQLMRNGQLSYAETALGRLIDEPSVKALKEARATGKVRTFPRKTIS